MAKKGKSSSSAIWVKDFDDDAAVKFHDEVWDVFSTDPTTPLVIHIDSQGGNAYSLINMWETMDNIRALAPDDFYFITYVHGCALSCGLLLAAHGDIRVATPKSELMFHEVSDSLEGREHQIQIHHDNLKTFTDKIYNVFVHDTEFKGGVEAARAWGEKDRWLNPQQAKDLGIIDIIGYIKPRQVMLSPVSIGEMSDLSLRKGKVKTEKPVKDKRAPKTKRTTRTKRK